MECEQSLLQELLSVTETDEYCFPNQHQLNSITNWTFDSFTDNTYNNNNNNNPFYTLLPIDHTSTTTNYSLLYDDLSPSDSFNTLPLETNYQTFINNYWQEESYNYSMFQDPFEVEHVQEIPCTFDIGQVSTEKGTKEVKNKVMKGNQSKNLAAERRRRKRLNDRLSMLRSVVPKISKMDRTSILGDSIDYMKELLERINNVQEEMRIGSTPLSSMLTSSNDVKPHEILPRHSQKFDVERNNDETRIEMCCAAKPGLLLSTVTTLESLGLEIQHCVISCFNDFAAQASCSHLDPKQGALLDSEDIKQALFRNAGYAGKYPR